MIFNPIELKKGAVTIQILNFTEFDPLQYVDFLTREEKSRLQTFSNNQRKMEFVATRFLRTQLFGLQEIKYDEVGAPFLEDDFFISISHSKNTVGIASCPTFQIGLDIEQISSKARTVQHKFLSENELQHFENANESELTKAWTAKETLYKLSGRNGVNFKRELHIKKQNEEIWLGEIKNESSTLTTELTIFELDNTIISVNISACK